MEPLEIAVYLLISIVLILIAKPITMWYHNIGRRERLMESQNRVLIEIALASGVSKEKIQADINQSNKQSTDRATKDFDSGKITRADYNILIDGLRN